MAANRLPFAFHSRYHLVTTTDVIDGFDIRFNLPFIHITHFHTDFFTSQSHFHTDFYIKPTPFHIDFRLQRYNFFLIHANKSCIFS